MNPFTNPTWMGAAPVPLTPKSRQMLGSGASLPRQGPHTFSGGVTIGLPMAPKSFMFGPGAMTPGQQMTRGEMPAPMPSMPMGGGGHGGGHGGGGGFSGSFAPTNFANGDRFNSDGYRADGRKQIKGFSYKDAGLPDFGGVDQNYAMQDRNVPAFYPGSAEADGTSAPEVVQRARDKGITSTPGGGIKGFADGGVPEVGKPAIVGERGPEMIVPLSPVAVIPNHELQPPAGWAAGSIMPEATPMKGMIPMPAPASPNWIPGEQLTPRSTGVASPEMKPMLGWAAGAVPESAPMAMGQMPTFAGPRPMANADAPATPAPLPRFQDVSGALAAMPNTGGRPDGVKPRAWKNFVNSPQGMSFMLNQQSDSQRLNQMTALDDKRYTRARQDKLSDMTAEQQAAQAEKDREASALTAGYDLMLKDYAGKGHLSQDHLAAFNAAKDPKARAMMGKVLAGLAESNMAAAAEQQKQEAARVTAATGVPVLTPDGRPTGHFLPITNTGKMAGSAMPLPQAAASAMTAEDIAAANAMGADVTTKVGNATITSKAKLPDNRRMDELHSTQTVQIEDPITKQKRPMVVRHFRNGQMELVDPSMMKATDGQSQPMKPASTTEAKTPSASTVAAPNSLAAKTASLIQSLKK